MRKRFTRLKLSWDKEKTVQWVCIAWTLKSILALELNIQEAYTETRFKKIIPVSFTGNIHTFIFLLYINKKFLPSQREKKSGPKAV